MSNIKPIGVCTPIRVETRPPSPNVNAVFVIVVCKDEVGREWEFPTSAFNFDMQLYGTTHAVYNKY